MSDPWLSIIGMGEDGPAGLPDASRRALAEAKVVFGAPRHLALADVGARGRPWPVPFDLAPLLALRGQRVAALVSGDPFWCGAGGSIAAVLVADEWRAYPAPGVISLAAARLGWRLEDCVTLGLHAAPFARLRPHLARGCRIIATLRDGDAPGALAAWLVAQGAGAARLTVLERLGGPLERVRQARAEGFAMTCAAPVAVAIDGADLLRGVGLASVPGRPEALFAHDGQITKSPVRAITLAALEPRPGALLWDIGGGSGSVSVEWVLAGGRAVTVEPRADRIAQIAANIDGFGLGARMTAVHGTAPEALEGLPDADAVFVGGGASGPLLDLLWDRLRPGARLVANAVTLETESLLAHLHARHGGRLLRLDIAEAQPLGRMRGWTAARPIVQWSVTR
ncbi:precorrin-6y C5,15-methyltransferase (decarboxylating) subunit CbiE [Paracoccus liaowanqingii]|uniref:Precorrin-6y C5,15-methyltransferase (Decarboxylating) subunit CbiE n=1 Tax=Paracoccus liaowanqingii TaxID=2560053 RepID=A0A4V1BIK6_9RHOB|nr:precorrin-6y C5,15-methyltransferase (decarboxylating) subunit CbiE [Paracoccus liaowanqingii]QBX33432.1 precorrin-6y C5,15-methyltransferase (decarboxylating) subunit CbiE [Paracoccus liaowanqingii]